MPEEKDFKELVIAVLEESESGMIDWWVAGFAESRAAKMSIEDFLT